MTSTQTMVTERIERAILDLLRTAKGARKARLEAKLAEVRAYRA